jgi:glutamate racemase
MPPSSSSAKRPIAVFDSGIGGLTVVSALRRELPGEDLVYLGDTARVPYGGKSRGTIERYSEEIAALLVGEGAKMVVVACNTASALALARLREVLSVPVEGVIEPGVEAALAATVTGHIAVLGTKATIGSGAYADALRAARPGIRVTSMACPLLVPLVEEGLFEDVVTDAVLSTDTLTVDAWTVTPSGTITYVLLGTPPASTSAPPTVLLSVGTGTGQVRARLGSAHGRWSHSNSSSRQQARASGSAH